MALRSNKKQILFFTLLLFPSIITNLVAKNWDDYELKGAVKSLSYARATYEYNFGAWDLTNFFPYSNRLSGVCDLSFDAKGRCLQEKYLLPSGKARYQVFFAYKSRSDGSLEERTGFDTISQEGDRLRIYYDTKGQKVREETFDAEHKVVENRYFYYKEGRLDYEEAYGINDQLFQKIIYAYDDLGRIASEEEWVYPYKFQSSQITYQYDDVGKVSEKRLYQFQHQLQQKHQYRYNEKGLLEREIIYQYDEEGIPPKQYKYFWETDSHGNWIQKVIVEMVFVRNRWIDNPKYIQCRNINYF